MIVRVSVVIKRTVVVDTDISTTSAEGIFRGLCQAKVGLFDVIKSCLLSSKSVKNREVCPQIDTVFDHICFMYTTWRIEVRTAKHSA